MFSSEFARHVPLPERAEEREVGQKISFAVSSVASIRHPERNEDASFALTDEKAFGVFDGMGGHAGGEIASQMGRDLALKAFRGFRKDASPIETIQFLRTTLQNANAEILSAGKANPNLREMGTTATVMKIARDERGEDFAIIGNVGDSRAYALYDSGNFAQITLDDNLMSLQIPDEKEAMEMQAKLNEVSSAEELAGEDRQFFSKRNVLVQALGKQGVAPRIYKVPLRDVQRLLFTSDGVHDNLKDSDIAKILCSAPDSSRASEEIQNATYTMSKGTGGRSKPDDITALTVDVGTFTPSMPAGANLTAKESGARPARAAYV